MALLHLFRLLCLKGLFMNTISGSQLVEIDPDCIPVLNRTFPTIGPAACVPDAWTWMTGQPFDYHHVFSFKFSLNGTVCIATYDGTSDFSLPYFSVNLFGSIGSSDDVNAWMRDNGVSAGSLFGSSSLFPVDDQTASAETYIKWNVTGSQQSDYPSGFIPYAVTMTVMPQTGDLGGAIDLATAFGITEPTSYHSCGYFLLG